MKIYVFHITHVPSNAIKHLAVHNFKKKESMNEMNENAELIKYIDVAENVYERVYENNQISNDLIVNLNRIMAEIKKTGRRKKI